jgi:hypothetical protein
MLIRVGHEKKNSYEEQKNVAPMSTNHEASYCVEKKIIFTSRQRSQY